jgi:hypothetical protein
MGFKNRENFVAKQWYFGKCRTFTLYFKKNEEDTAVIWVIAVGAFWPKNYP